MRVEAHRGEKQGGLALRGSLVDSGNVHRDLLRSKVFGSIGTASEVAPRFAEDMMVVGKGKLAGTCHQCTALERRFSEESR